MAGFETSPFGDQSTNVVTDVNTHFGQRDTKQVNGVSKTEGLTEELVINVLAADVTAAAYPLLAPTLPAGAVIQDAFVNVQTAFALGGTTPAIEVGTETSEATNGFTITEAQAEAVAVYDVTAALSGTWAAPLAAATTVGLALSGTSPTNGTAGELTVTIRYTIVSGA